jgi:hypothetical protein
MWGNERMALIMNPEGVQQQQNPLLMLNHVVVLFLARNSVTTGFTRGYYCSTTLWLLH